MKILGAIARNTTGRPVVAQVIGNDIPELVRTAWMRFSVRYAMPWASSSR